MSRTLTQTHKRFFPLQPARKSGIVYTPKIQCVREKIGKLPFSFHHLEQLADSNNGNRLYKMNQLKYFQRHMWFHFYWAVLKTEIKVSSSSGWSDHILMNISTKKPQSTRWCNKLHFTPGRCECLQTSSPQKKEYMVFKFNSVHTKGFVYLFLFTHCII